MCPGCEVAPFSPQDQMLLDLLLKKKAAFEDAKYQAVWKIIDEVFYNGIDGHDVAKHLIANADRMMSALSPHSEIPF
jgi:hypothetical protein